MSEYVREKKDLKFFYDPNCFVCTPPDPFVDPFPII